MKPPVKFTNKELVYDFSIIHVILGMPQIVGSVILYIETAEFFDEVNSYIVDL